MNISQHFKEQDLKKYATEKMISEMHGAVNGGFRLPKYIVNSPDPEQKLNELLIKESFFSFSFVRHPYTRYTLSV